MRKICLCLLMMLLFALPCVAEEETLFELDGVVYRLEDDRALVERFSPDAERIVVHAEVQGLPVDLEWKLSCNSEHVREFIVEEGVQGLCGMFFGRCTNLERVQIDATTTDDEDSMDQPYNVSLWGCPKLAEFWMDRCNAIWDPQYEIVSCPSLKELAFPEGLGSVGLDMIDMDGLERLILPETMKYLGLLGEHNLRTFEAHPDNPYLYTEDGVLFSREGPSLFLYPSAREGTQYTVPEGVVGVRRVPENGALESLFLPASMRDADLSLNNLKRIEVHPDNPYFKSVDGVLYSKDGRRLLTFPARWGLSYTVEPGTVELEYIISNHLQCLSFPEGVQSLRSLSLVCPNLLRIALPATLKDLNAWNFGLCPNLRHIEISPAHPAYRSIDGVVFTADGRELVFIPPGRDGTYAIPEGTTTISEDAFRYANRLERLILPASLTTIPGKAFVGLDSLVAFEVSPENPNFSAMDVMLLDKAGETLIACPAAGSVHCEVPQGVKHIGAHAFARTAHASHGVLESVNLPRGLLSIGESAFAGNANLRRVALPLTLERIGAYAFEDCPSLEKLVLPPGVTELPQRLFSFSYEDLGEVSPLEVWVPESVRVIDR